MTDTNNTDGAALLPVTQSDRDAAASIASLGSELAEMRRDGRHDGLPAVQAFARHRISHSLPGDVGTAAINQNDAMRQELAHVGNMVSELARAMGVDQANDDGSWPDLAGRIEKLIAAALTPSPLPATQEDAERSGAGGVSEVDIALLGARMVLEGKATNATGALAKSDWKPSRHHIEGMRNTMREAIEYLDEARTALSTPQRQAYDGEAVREALERFLADYDDGDRADAGVHPLMEAHIADFRAALAHPAQATPSALSGEAGEAMSKRTLVLCVSGKGPTPHLEVHFANLADAHAAHNELLGIKEEAADAR